MQRILVTGATGFVGSHLLDYLLSMDGIEVYGIKRWRSRTENIEHLSGGVAVIECDLRDQGCVTRVVESIKPDKIFHLAAQSYVPASWSAPQESLTTNILCNLHVLEAVRHLGIRPRIQVAGSSEEYGLVHPDELPIKETNPLRPLSPYGVSKVAQDLLGYQYYMSYGMDIVRTRGFNHTGPRRGDVFVTSNLAKQIVEIEAKKKEPVVYVGNLDAKRDFSDVRDMVKAYWLALEKGKPGEVYNICSGVAYSIREVLDMLLSMAKVEIELRVDSERLRPSDVPVLLGDNTKFVEATGWKPAIPFEETLRDILDYWRQKIRSEHRCGR